MMDGSGVLQADINSDGRVDLADFLALSASFGTFCECPEDIDGNGRVGFADFVRLAQEFGQTEPERLTASGVDSVFAASGKLFDTATYTANLSVKDSNPDNLLRSNEVEALLKRASQATSSNDAIIAVVDRAGRILGVSVEDGVAISDPEELAFAIDGAVAKARTAAFFSSNAAPLTSRTIRFISQSTITQREVESSPTNDDPRYQGPGFVAPIGVGGHFPPEIPFTPQVDLFAIEHQSRDSQTHPGPDGIKGNGDDFELPTRFNANLSFVPTEAESFFGVFPESYGEQAGTAPNSIPRGIGTLPGGVPLYKAVVDPPANATLLDTFNLVGGIGVFFPGEDGFATYEQNFHHGVGQSEANRTNAPRVLEAEFAALVAAAGSGPGLVGPNAFDRDLTEFNIGLDPLDNFLVLTGRIDLVGITLEIFGPTPTQANRKPGIDQLIELGRILGRGTDTGVFQQVLPGGTTLLDGQAVPEGWLVAPHDSADGLTAADVREIIEAGIAEAERTRAAIRLDINNGIRPGVPTAMVLAVADTNGELLGLHRMPDATIFSIDVSVAKARNTAYYADPADLVDLDRVDFNGDGITTATATTIADLSGDTYPTNTALTNRSFRFLVEPRFPTGIELPSTLDDGLVNDAALDLCDQKGAACVEVGPQSMLRLPGINPLTAENLVNADPLPFDVYASLTPATAHRSTVTFDAFNVMRNFRDPGDAGVGLANQNGVVFFPGSTPLYVNGRTQLAGGFGVSGDGVDQDDVVTSAGQQGLDPLKSIRVDAFTIGGIRVPFQKFNRNPFGD